DVDVIEAHGTGTALGDPIEAQALLATYGASHSAERPVLLGSLKSNFGHTQAAAGVGGIIKLLLAMQHELLPKTLHAEQPSRHVDWSSGALRLVTAPMPWPQGQVPRRAGVSSFGVSGTNAHVILEEAPAQESAESAAGAEESGSVEPVASLVVLSGRTEEGLRAVASRLSEQMQARPGDRLSDVSYSLATTRSGLEYRASWCVSTREALLERLGELSRGASEVVRVAAGGPGKLGWVFSGQGSQRLGMGRELSALEPVFREALEAAFAELDRELERPLRAVMWGAAGSESEGLLEQTSYAQPALFAVEWALGVLWRSWGLEPEVLVGHSVGEIAAACHAGVFSLADGARVVSARGRLMQGLATGGAMVSVSASEAEVQSALEGYESEVSIAASNAPSSVVISGSEGAVAAVVGRLAERGVRSHRLAVSHAFHSPLMRPMQASFAEVLRGVSYRPAQLKVVSTVSGRVAGSELSTAEYWSRHVMEPVRFASAVKSAAGLGVKAYLELGGQATLLSLIAQTLSGSEPVLLPSFRRGRSEPESMRETLGNWFTRGGDVRWSEIFPGAHRRVSLPSYPFQRQRYWLDAGSATGDVSSVGLTRSEHPLLGARVSVAEGDGVLLTGRLSLSSHDWLRGHAVLGEVVVAGAALLELVQSAGAELGAGVVDELTLEHPLVIGAGESVELQVSFGGRGELGRREVLVHARGGEESGWERHAQGSVIESAGAELGAESSLREWPPRGGESLELSGVYEQLAEQGLR
ncbi:MAG TPA: type I polyketide synthase, partial [Polyangiaceae bacterium]